MNDLPKARLTSNPVQLSGAFLRSDKTAGLSDDGIAVRNENLKFYNDCVHVIQHYFDNNRHVVSAAALHVVLKNRIGFWRKDNLNPDYAHQVDQLLPFYNALRLGIIDTNKIDVDVIDMIFAAKALHDEGEDRQMFFDDLVLTQQDSFQELTGAFPDKNENQKIKQVAQMVEYLTHYRKFDPAYFDEYTIPFDIPIPEGDEIIPLPWVRDRMAHLFEAAGLDCSNLTAFVRLKEKHDGQISPLVIIGRHGDDRYPEQDWNSYSREIKNDLLLMLIKRDDRITGMSTRVSMATNPIKLVNYGKYLARTRLLFADSLSAENLEREKSSPFTRYYKSQEAVMGILDKIGRSFIEHSPHRTSQGDVRFNPFEMELLNFGSNFEHAFEIYEDLPARCHPIVQILSQISDQVTFLQEIDYRNNNDVQGTEFLLRQIMASLVNAKEEKVISLLEKTDLLTPERKAHINRVLHRTLFSGVDEDYERPEPSR